MSTGSSDNYHVALYGGSQWGALGLRVGAAYSWHDIETARSVSLPGLSGKLSADYSAGTQQDFAELGYKIGYGGITFEPFGHIASVKLHTRPEETTSETQSHMPN